MRFIYWGLVGLVTSATPPQRLRHLFDLVKGFARESSTVASVDNSNTIIESAVRFAHNEGRELEHFIQVMRTVCKNDISKCDLDKISWDALARLFEEKSVPQPATVAAAPVVEPTPISDSAEYLPIEKSSRKRSIEDEADAVGSDRREEVLSILKFHKSLRNEALPVQSGKGIDFLNYMHYRMVVHGEFDQLLYHLELLGATNRKQPQQILQYFEDAYTKLIDPFFRFSQSFEERMESEYKMFEDFHKSFSSNLAQSIKKLRYICFHRAPEYKEPHGATQEMSDRLLQMAKDGDWKGLRYAMNIYEYANYTLVRKRTILQRTLDYLEEQLQNNILDSKN